MHFITSKDRPADGAGKLIASEETDSIVEYFIAPGEPIERRTVATNSLKFFSLELQERIYFEDGHIWRVGRFDGFRDPDDPTQLDLILPNADNTTIHSDDAYIRSSIPLENPLPLLQSRNTETPFWHDRRAAFLRELHEQRSLYRGLTALASSNVEIVQHQLTVVRKVLNDPITRYLLADEVGLGKTIEAGIIVRQYLLDHGDRARIRILVPDHLVAQWRQELEQLFHLDEARHNLELLAHCETNSLETDDPTHTLLVVDEAHLIAQHAYVDGPGGASYRHVQKHSHQSNGLLLLSATPIVHNEDTFLAMLHLLDPDTHPLTDRVTFQQRIANRENVADAIRDLEDDGGAALIEPVLDDLKPLGASNELLRGQLNAVAAVVHTDDSTQRQDAIAQLRSYLQATYRLDRRMLRTRRRGDHVSVHLPTRKHTVWESNDLIRTQLYEWLDDWRLQAPSTDECADVFLEMLDTVMQHPSLLQPLIDKRLQNLEDGAHSYFDGEKIYLSQRRPSIDIKLDERVRQLGERFAATRYQQQYVVFVSSFLVAEQIATTLRESFRLDVLHLVDEFDPQDTIRLFLKNKQYSALICDQERETGLNIQQSGANIIAVHFDVPLLANRIEQRIGRLDRLHGDRCVESLVPQWPSDSGTTNYEQAWTACLIETVKVFDRSVATLQHALDAGRQRLRTTILAGGVDAIIDLTAEWGDDNNVHSLNVELQTIESQELIDELQVSNDHETFYEQLDDYEYDNERIDRFSQSVKQWATECLGFRHRSCPRNDPTCLRAVAYQYKDSKTLLPRSQVAHSFPSLTLQSRLFRDINTGWMHFDRQAAATLKLPIARTGHPFISELQTQIAEDDRGRVFAYWKTVKCHPKYALHNLPEVYFCFDFLIESDPEAVAPLITSQRLSASAIRRRLDYAFPPRFVTKWIDLDGREVIDQTLIKILSRRYTDGDNTNLHDSDWAQIDRLSLIGDWSSVCKTAFGTAKQVIEHDADLRSKVQHAQTILQTQFRENRNELTARIAAAPNNSDRSRLTLETDLYTVFQNALAQRRVRLDAVGAIFLATKPIADYLADDQL